MKTELANYLNEQTELLKVEQRLKDPWMNRQIELRIAVKSQREQALQAIESQFELENDEFYTAREKAVKILNLK